MAFKVKLVSEKKLRKNQQAQNLSQGVGSLLGSLGQTMAHSAQRRAAEEAGAQLNQQLGLNVPSNVYGQASPSALLGMLANAQMAAKAQTENMNRIMEAETIRGRAKVEAEKLRMLNNKPYHDYLRQKAENDAAVLAAKQSQESAQNAAIQKLGLDPSLPQNMNEILLRNRQGGSGSGGGAGPFDWKQSGLSEEEARKLHSSGYSMGTLGAMTGTARSKAIGDVLGPQRAGGGTKGSDIRGNIDTFRQQIFEIDNDLYGPQLEGGGYDPSLSIDTKISAAERAGDMETANALRDHKMRSLERKAQLWEAHGRGTDALMGSVGGADEELNIEALLNEIGVTDEE